EELDHLTGEAHAARTRSDLDLVCANLPAVGVAPPVPAEGDARRPFTGGQIGGATALTLLVPAGRLIGLVIALSLLRGDAARAAAAAPDLGGGLRRGARP